MTHLLKPVRRVSELPGLRGADAGPYVVSLYPGGLLGLRRCRSRKELQVPLSACYGLASKLSAQREREMQHFIKTIHFTKEG